MPEEPTHSDRSAALARADKAHLLHSIEVARSLGAVSPGHGGEPPPGVDDPSFDPALDLPLGMEPVGARPRELVLRETDPPGEMLPRGILAQTAVEELAKAAAELGCPTFTPIGLLDCHAASRRMRPRSSFLMDERATHRRAHARGTHSDRRPLAAHLLHSVDLTGGERPLLRSCARSAIRASLVAAVMDAATAPRRPTTIYVDFVDEARRAQWPELPLRSPHGAPRRSTQTSWTEERRARWPQQKAMRRRIDGTPRTTRRLRWHGHLRPRRAVVPQRWGGASNWRHTTQGCRCRSRARPLWNLAFRPPG